MKLQLLAILAFIARVVDAEDVEEAEAARPEIKAVRSFFSPRKSERKGVLALVT
jgi:hypothetical protein